MSLTLILMRHAKSSWDHPGLADHDRPLNARGRKSAVAMGDWLRQHGHIPDTAQSSSSRRTMETFEGLGFDCPVQFSRGLFHTSSEGLLRALNAATGSTLLMLGHNPGIGDFAERIVRSAPSHDRFGDYPTCATLVAHFDVDTWSNVTWGSGTAIDFAIPREVLASGA